MKAFSSEKAFSQSYISNGDFEIAKECPKFWSEKVSDFNVEGWYSPSKQRQIYLQHVARTVVS